MEIIKLLQKINKPQFWTLDFWAYIILIWFYVNWYVDIYYFVFCGIIILVLLNFLNYENNNENSNY